MAFDDLKERIKNSAETLGDRLTESRLYQSLNDRYENLSISQQRIVKFLSLLTFAFLILLSPVGQLLSSYELEADIESKRDLIRKMIKTRRTMSNLPDIPPVINADSVRTDIEFQFKSMNLLPEQIKKISVDNSPRAHSIPAKKVSYGIDVALEKLNLKQVHSIGHRLQAINPSLKLLNLNIKLNSQDKRYLDAEFKLIGLNVPTFTQPLPPVEEAPKKNKKNKKSDSNESESNT